MMSSSDALNKCETTMRKFWKSKGIVIISLHWESNHFFPRKLLLLLDFVSCSSPMSMSFISSCLSFLVCLKALDFKVAISKGATAAASEWSLGQGFCVLNVLSIFSDFRSWENLTQKWLEPEAGYCKVVSSNTSHLEAHAGFSRFLMKGVLILIYCNLLTKSWFPN